MLKSILFTHDDLDGAGCRIIYEIAHSHMINEEEFEVINSSNNSIDDDVINNVLNNQNVNTNTEICFADIVASRETLEKLKEEGYNDIKIWDHHRTNFFVTWVVPDATIVPENELGVLQSGTSLLYQYYCSLPADDPRSEYFLSGANNRFVSPLRDNRSDFISRFVDTVRSYDTYEFKETGNLTAKKLQMFFSFIGMDNFCERYVKHILNFDIVFNDSIVLADNDLKFVIDQKIINEKMIIQEWTPDNVKTFNVKGYKCAFSFPVYGANISELAYQFLKKYTDYDIYVSCTFEKGNGTFQFRTVRDDIDLGAEIAVPIGGGGHPKAAGASVPEELVSEIIQILENLLNN